MGFARERFWLYNSYIDNATMFTIMQALIVTVIAINVLYVYNKVRPFFD